MGDGELGKLAALSELSEAARMSWNLDGERDSDRLRERTAALTSTWCTPVGDGSVRVPPLEFEKDISLECDGLTPKRCSRASF